MPRLVAIVGAVAGLVAVFLPGGAVRPDRPDADVVVGAVGLVLVAAATFLPRQRFARYWVVRLVTAGLAVAVAAVAVVHLLDDVGAGLPGSSTAVLAGSATVVVLGLAADAARPLRPPVTAAVIVLLVAAAVAGALLTPGWPVQADQAAAVKPEAMADHPGTHPWSWRSPGEVIEVVPAGAGVVVGVTGGRLVALDGPTGRARWHYTRVGAHLSVLRTTPDRALVVAAFAPGGDRTGIGDVPFTGAELLVVLDATTGAVVRESTEDYEVTSWRALAPTDTVLPARERVGSDDSRLRAVDLRTGEERWRWAAPRGCTAPVPNVESNTAHLVLTPVRCGGRTSLVALDERTGRQRWDHTTTATEHRVQPGGEFVAVGAGGVSGVDVADQFLWVDDGREVPTLDPEVWLNVGPHPVRNLATDRMDPSIIDLGTTQSWPLPMMSCAGFVAHATTDSTYLEICRTGDDMFLTWQDIAGGPVGRTAITWARDDVQQRYDHPPATLSGPAVAIIPAPGAVVLARSAGTEVLGYP